MPDGFQKGLALNVASGAADLCDDHIGVGVLSHGVNKFFDLVRHMGDHLYGFPQILAPALLVQHVPVDLAGGEVGEFIEVLVDETLVVAQIKVSFRAVLRDVDLPMLVGTHGARVDVDIGVQLLRGNLQAAGL